MILLTGAAGFIGSNILAELNAGGSSDVVICDRLGSALKWRNIAKHKFADFISPDELTPYLERSGNDIQAVIHMGANSSTTATDGDAILRTNLRASMTLWRWCAGRGVPLVYASSAATYGDGSAGFDDDDDDTYLARLTPLNLYGWSKHAFDRWVMERVREGYAPPRWAAIKFFNVYGPNEYHKGQMMSLVAKTYPLIATNDSVKLFKSHCADYADGEQLRDFVYVKDCARAVVWFVEHGVRSGIYNLGTGTARSFLDLINAVGTALGKEVKIYFVDMPGDIRRQYQYFTRARMTKLAIAGYTVPFHSIEDGVRDYVQCYLSTCDAYR